MKNENKTISVLILIFPGKNAFRYQRKSLKNDSTNIFVTSRKFNHIGRPSFYRNGFESSIPISFARRFLASWYVDVRDKTSTFSKQIGKVLAGRKKTSIFTRTLRKKDFRMQRFWISHFFLNLISKVSCLHDSFDGNEGLLRFQRCWQGKRPRNMKLSSERQFIIPKEKSIY